MDEKLKVIQVIFSESKEEDAPIDVPEDVRAPLSHGKYYGGVYNGRKYMYSEKLINTMTPERLELFIKKQIGYQTT